MTTHKSIQALADRNELRAKGDKLAAALNRKFGKRRLSAHYSDSGTVYFDASALFPAERPAVAAFILPIASRLGIVARIDFDARFDAEANGSEYAAIACELPARHAGVEKAFKGFDAKRAKLAVEITAFLNGSKAKEAQFRARAKALGIERGFDLADLRDALAQ